jgi:hypothetical protein
MYGENGAWGLEKNRLHWHLLFALCIVYQGLARMKLDGFWDTKVLSEFVDCEMYMNLERISYIVK